MSRAYPSLAKPPSYAIKFTPDGGAVWVRAAHENGQARIEVGDTGPGIPNEDRQRIFLEFVAISG